MLLLDALSAVAALPLWVLALTLAVALVTMWQYRHRHYNGVYVKPYIFSYLAYKFFKMDRDLDNLLVVEMEKTKQTTLCARVPGQPLFFITVDPANVEHILKTNFENYVKGKYFIERMSDVLGTGIFAVDGDLWHSQRKMTSTLFYGRNFETNMTDVFQKHGTELVHLLREHAGTPVDIHDIYHRFTLDSIGAIAFGHHIGSLQDRETPFARAWDRTNEHIVWRFFFPYFRILRYGKNGKRVVKDIPFLKEFAGNIVRGRRAEIKSGAGLERADLLSLMLQRRDDRGAEFSDQFLTDMALNIILAGRDTTAQSLSWTTMLLAQHPEVLRKLVAEVDEIVGDELPSYQHIQAMHYMYAVVSESLRLYPSVPRDPKVAVKEDILPDGTVVPAGAAVVYFPYGMGRRKELWGEDALQFRPERFLKVEDGEVKRVKPSLFKFSAFQAGPRTCLGQHMAYLEESIVLALILQNFTFSLEPNQSFRIKMNLTCPMQDGLRVTMQPRADKRTYA